VHDFRGPFILTMNSLPVLLSRMKTFDYKQHPCAPGDVMNFLPLLKRSKFFADLSDEELSKVRDLARERHFLAADKILRENELGHSLFIIGKGSVDVFKTASAGEAPVARLAEGEIFGELSLYDSSNRVAAVVAVDDVVALEIDYCKLKALIKTDAELGVKLLMAVSTSVSEKLKRTTSDLVNLVLSSRLIVLGQMAASVGHEINNPLCVLQLKLDHLDDLVSADIVDIPEMRKSIEVCKTITERISRIVHGLNMAGRNCKNDPAVQVKLRALLSDTLEFCSSRFKTNGVSLLIPMVGEEIAIECRPVQISQVLLNLLNNALDAVMALDERWVRVEVEDRSSEVIISVMDSGAGIPKEIRALIFEPFYTTKSNNLGTGLGLSISRKIIEGHGGSLSLDENSVQTRFLIRIPKKKYEQ